MKNVLTIVSLLFSTPFLGAECPPIKTNQRDIVLLPDTASDELVQAFGYYATNSFQIDMLEKQLIAQAAPVLVELTIWKRFAKKVNDEKKMALLQLPFAYYQIDNFMLCMPEKWHAKHPATGFNLVSAKRVTEPFLLLPKIHDPLIALGKTTLMLANLYGSIVTTLRKLLISKTDERFSWNVLLFGHGGPMLGSYTDRIAGLPSLEFKKLLSFFNNEISTNIFLYQTCYAGSKWLLRFYETSDKPDTYNYPIILTGITDAPVYSWNGRNPAIYQNFFEKMRTISLCSEKSRELFMIAAIFLQTIFFDATKKRYVLSRINNSIQVRWAGSGKFKVIEIDDVVATAKTAKKSGQDTVTISSNAFIIDTPYLDKTVVVGPDTHSISSAIKQNGHFVKEMTLSGQFDSNEAVSKKLFDLFGQVKDLSFFSSKLYLMDTVNDAKKEHALTNVMIFMHGSTPSAYPLMRKTELFYVHDADGYLLDGKHRTIKHLPPKMKEQYLKIFNDEKEKLTLALKKR